MPPTTKGLTPLIPLEQEFLGKLSLRVGEKIAFPDYVDPVGESPDDNHVQAGMYGIIRVIGIYDNAIKFDCAVVDPFTGLVQTDDDGEEVIHRAGLGEFQ